MSLHSKFELHRGGKVVAFGCRFPACAVLCWEGDVRSTTVYPDMASLRKIHVDGHADTELYVTGDAYSRGAMDAIQDRCEGVANLLGHRKDSAGRPQKPGYLVADDWDDYLRGYEWGFRKMWGTDAPWLN